ncbi:MULTISPECIES: FecR domain-containing protein [unclassified Acidovorax]|uniref:FecR family protein n=1 Tax=unclassified Acidovorax TaxID=2684926 RepID=UPI0028831F07|nr:MULTISPECIES: FecR domain-containing protein [unclassified Acidovorax]
MSTTAPATAREEAARWFVRLQGTAADGPERATFHAWLGAHPGHAHEYAAFEALWQDFDSTLRTQALAAAAQAQAGHMRQRRRRVAGGLLGLAGLCALGLLGSQGWQAFLDRPQFALARSTAPGQRLRVPLPDGSTLTLGGDSAIALHYSRRQRTVVLSRGEALFSVAADAARPFVVDSGAARTTVVGTRFAVDRLPGRVRVSVQEGTVRLASRTAEGAPLLLHAGEVGEVRGADGLAGLPERLAGRSAQEAFAIERGVLVFEQASLAEIAATLSRYHATPVQATASEGPRITAAVQVRDIDGFITALPRIAAVRVERRGGAVRLSAR